ncbi:MAG: replication initiation factor domain-containing protein, partial [Phycisphaerales bacterium]|nr:replication initiation factor domain-containing protein [Phycisphaerales bacterium]
PARWEPEGSSPDQTTGIYPHFVTPGIENHVVPNQVPPKGMSCRPDWIRLIGPESQFKEVNRILLRQLGPSTGRNKGAIYFDEGIQWHPGVLLSFGHRSKIVMVDLQGSRLATMKTVEAMRLTSSIMMEGFRCNRIDLAVDHVETNHQLYNKALKSCKAGQLCKLRSYSPNPRYKADGTPTCLLLNLGKRDSDICARIYDKGLETETLEAGMWERFEMEIKNARANEVCMTLVSAGDRLPEALWRYVIGAVDFRIANGRSELARRPQAKWWARYIGQATPLDTPPIPKESSLYSWCSWFRSSPGRRLLQLAQIFGIPPQELLLQLIEGLEPAKTIVPATVEAELISRHTQGQPTANS